MTALIYVDDVVLARNNVEFLQKVKDYLNQKFRIKDLERLKYFLGIKVVRFNEGFVLSQGKYTLDILKDTRMQGCKPWWFPMEKNINLRISEEETCVDVSRYKRLLGILLYLTINF